ncbi:MAG: hypothetical protein K6G80_04015 [Treponema sp.]|nr:hypothetical protein [Treponema sp.]
MHRQAVITSIDSASIHAIALVSDMCSTCPSTCGRTGKPFLVSNKYNLPIKEGSVVRVYHSQRIRGISGIMALLMPLACGLLAYRLSPELAERLRMQLTEAFKSVCVLAGILIPSTAIFIINRSTLHLFKPEITQIL